MVEIRYGDYSEQADLAGKSIAEAREQYKLELGIPDKAIARVNDQNVKKKLESETRLEDNDEVRFVKRSHKGLVLIGAMLLALAATGGVFAATALTQTVTGNITAESDFVALTTGNTPSWTAFGKFVGQTGTTSEVFKATPADSFNGDFVILLTITNVDELSEVYQVLNLRFSAQNGTFTSVTSSPTAAVLSLEKPVTEIEVTAYDSGGDGSKYIDIQLDGGFYKSNTDGGWTPGYEDPDIFCQIVQKGT
jgi:hypothetical protein